MSLPALDLPVIDQMRGGDPTLVRDELVHVIEAFAGNRPRANQVAIGPSELGTPCARKLGYKLAAVTSSATPRAVAWRPIIGIATHQWLNDVFTASNVTSGYDRWLTEYAVDVGEVDDVPIQGHVDLYDRVTATVVDWKIVGPTTLRSVKAHGASAQYQTQVQLYGRGWERRGMPVDTVAVYFLPSNGELYEAVWWSAPYDESVATAALDRATKIRVAQRLIGADEVNAMLPIAEDFCTYCPFYAANAGPCPGAVTRKQRSTLSDLIV